MPRIGKAVWLAALCAALCACVSSQVMLGAARPPIAPDLVKIYFQPPPTPYERIAILDTSSSFSFALTAQGKTDAVIARLKAQAARLGANGVLLEGLGDRPSGSIGTGFGRTSFSGGGGFSTGIGIAGTVVQKVGHGIAIYVAPAPAAPQHAN